MQAPSSSSSSGAASSVDDKTLRSFLFASFRSHHGVLALPSFVAKAVEECKLSAEVVRKMLDGLANENKLMICDDDLYEI